MYCYVEFYREAIGKGVKINNHTASFVEKKVKKVKEVMVSLVEQGFIPNMVIYNTFVNGYCQIGDI
jgi:hypothetical protein